MPILNIFIENTYSDFQIDETKIHLAAIKMTDFLLQQKNLIEASCLKNYDVETLCFDIVLCDNAYIQRINKEYRQKDCPTDVISFAIFADSDESERFVFDNEISLGEIIISLDKIKEQAEENNVSYEDEFNFILSHGILHCLGFDHLTDEDYTFMINTQNKAKGSIYV